MDRPPDDLASGADKKTDAGPDKSGDTIKATKEPEVLKPEDVPDPDEDDLDDLDDILDDFSAKSSTQKPQAAPVPEPATKHEPSRIADLPIAGADDLDEKLQSGMEELFKDMQTSPDVQKQFEELMKNLGVSDQPLPDIAGEGSSKGPTSAKSADDGFQETIRKTMERMQESGDQASAAVNADESTDILAEMLKQMPGGGGLDGPESEEDFSKMILGMMEQLTNKDILYDPMKELHDKYPAWMESHQGTTPAEDMQRYKTQQGLVSEIVAKFEAPGYADSNTADREYIVERMQKMQAAGSPPPDLVGDMSAAQEALGDLDSGCPQQ